MSEYASDERSKKAVPLDETVFTDEFLHELGPVREAAMYDLNLIAPQKVEDIAPEVVNPVEQLPLEGAAVSLKLRELAMRDIMEYYNYMAKLKGVRKVRSAPGNKFDSRYNDPNSVHEGMERKKYDKERRFAEALHILAGTEQLRTHFGDDMARAAYRSVERDLSDFQPGVSNATERARVVKRVGASIRPQRSAGRGRVA